MRKEPPVGPVLVLLAQMYLLVHSQLQCNRNPPDGNDCSTIAAGDCNIPTEEGFEEIMIPAANTRSCFRTCIRPDPLIGDTCEVNRVIFENSTLPSTIIRSGMYRQWRMFSPNFNSGRLYRKSTICRYYAVCRPDQMLSFTLDRHNLEPPVVCTDTARCVDSLTMYRPIYGNGSVSITCGAVEGFIGFELSSLLVEFKTNRKIEDCGFRIFVTCTDQELSFSQGCTTPNEPTEQKRKRREGLQNIFNIRTKRTFRKVSIIITRDAAVRYSDYTVRVIRRDRVLYRFPNIRVLQVFNRAERYLRFSRSAPEGRDFPGYGFLKIGHGVIHYIQEGINPVFRPRPAEEIIIQTMVRRMALAFADEDFDVGDPADGPDPPPNPPGCIPTPFTEEQERLLREQALMFGTACNGVLRATACAFQEVIMKRDCLNSST